jgi:hypothetical protein
LLTLDTMEIAFFTQHIMVMGDFLSGCKEEYSNCKFPAFNSGKTIEGSFMRYGGGAEEW